MHLARYFDVDYYRHDAIALSKFIGLPLEFVFPMSYDISDIAVGHAECVSRKIPNVPAARLSEQELINLTFK